MAFASHNTRMAIAASPAPRKIAFCRKSSMMLAFPPSITIVNRALSPSSAGSAPISASSRRALNPPAKAMIVETMMPSASTCTAATAAPSRSFSPIRLDTVAVAPMHSAIATEYTTASIDSVRPTVATASAPSFATKKTSTTTNSDSMLISSTIGTASRSTAGPTGPSV